MNHYDPQGKTCTVPDFTGGFTNAILHSAEEELESWLNTGWRIIGMTGTSEYIVYTLAQGAAVALA